MTTSISIGDTILVASHLVSLSKIDTLYRDQYLLRARARLQGQLSAVAYRDLRQQRTRLANLPNQIRNAMSDGDWGKVRELSGEHETLQAEIARKSSLEETGKAVYEIEPVSIDPFSPGMNTIPGVARRGLEALRDEARNHLRELSNLDRDWQTFYQQRIESFTHLQTETGPSTGQLRPSSGELENEAVDALEEGNYSKLARLAEGLSSKQKTASAGTRGDSTSVTWTEAPPDYNFSFKNDTLKLAKKLGLEWQYAPSQHKEFAPLCRFAWHPSFAQLQDNHSDVLRVPDLPFPQGTPDALKARVQLFATHPMINSAGVRFLPNLTEEDVLVETFDEPSAGSDTPHSALLEALGLPQRSQLSRSRIEAALLENGNQIVEQELGLDQFLFRLVCIPPDLHLRLGLERGWGQQKIWTHFDGYLVMMDGSLRPLAGGDVRYGGIYDLLGLPRNYDSDRIIVRFAVVQRRRMALWQ